MNSFPTSKVLIIVLVLIIIGIAWLMLSILFGTPSTKKKNDNQNSSGKDASSPVPDINVDYSGVVNVSEEDGKINIIAEEEWDPWLDYEPAEEEISPIEGTYDKNYWRNWDRKAFSQKQPDNEEKERPEAVREESHEQTQEISAQKQVRYGVFRDDYELLPYTDSSLIEY